MNENVYRSSMAVSTSHKSKRRAEYRAERMRRISLGFVLPPLMGAAVFIIGFICIEGFDFGVVIVIPLSFLAVGVQSLICSLIAEFLLQKSNDLVMLLGCTILGALALPLYYLAFLGAAIGFITGIILRSSYQDAQRKHLRYSRRK